MGKKSKKVFFRKIRSIQPPSTHCHIQNCLLKKKIQEFILYEVKCHFPTNGDNHCITLVDEQTTSKKRKRNTLNSGPRQRKKWFLSLLLCVAAGGVDILCILDIKPPFDI